MIFHTYGGTMLNFCVTAYVDEASLLAADPGPNEIGVITSIQFPGWCFDQREPEGPEEGYLWFKTGESIYADAPFSALQGNAVMVYPLSAFQYQSGAWVEVPARTYQEKDGVSQWVTWIKQNVYLVKDGLLQMAFETDGTGRMAVTQNDGSVAFSASENNGYAVIPLDLTHYSSLVIEGTKFAVYASNKIGAWETGVAPQYANAAAAASFESKTGKTVLDISALSGVYNVGIMLLGGAAFEAVVTDFYLGRS